MPTFEYEATDDDGRIVRGTEIGPELSQVIQNLALRGLLVTKINAAGGFDPIPDNFAAVQGRPAESVSQPEAQSVETGYKAPPKVEEQPLPFDGRSYFATNIWGPIAGQVPLTNLALFFRQFAAMASAAVPLVTALDTLAKQEHSSKLSLIVGEMRENARQGKPISDAMQRYPEVFTPLQVSLMRAGESGGFMEKASKLNAEYLETDIEIRALYRRETAYPKIVVAASIVIISVANAIIKAIGRTDTSISSPLTDWAVLVFVIPICVGLFLFFKLGLTNPRIRYNWDLFLLKIPYLGVTMHQFAMAKFGRALAALQKGGVPVGTSIGLAADSCGNEYLRSQIHPAGKRLESGAGIVATLGATGAFSPLVLDMMATGEMTGSLDSMLDKVSDYYESEAKVRSQQLGRTTGVAAMVLVGIYVGYIVISFYAGYASKITSGGGE